MKRFMNSWILLFAALVFTVALLSPLPVQAAGPVFRENIVEPIAFRVFVPCANGGVGEIVAFSGNSLLVAQIVMDGNGGFHETQTENFQGVSGVGLTSGVKYQVPETNHITLNGTVGVEKTITNTVNVIGQGPGNNLLFKFTLHETVNANGTVTSSVDNERLVCQ